MMGDLQFKYSYVKWPESTPQTKQKLIERKHRGGLVDLRRCHPRGNGEAPVYHPDLILDYPLVN